MLNQNLFYLLIFIIYFGIVGYETPWKGFTITLLILLPIFIISLIYSLVIFIKDLFDNDTKKNKDKKYKKDKKSKKKPPYIKIILTILIPLIIYLYAIYFNPYTPLYGEDTLYNPLSILGLTWGGSETYNKGGSPTNMIGKIFFKIYRFFITILSSNIYLTYGHILPKTLLKALVGYAPKDEPLEKVETGFKKWILNFIQYRIVDKGADWTNYVGGLFRRLSIVGLDPDAMDKTFRSTNYQFLEMEETEEPLKMHKSLFDIIFRYLRKIIIYFFPKWEDSKNLAYFLNWIRYTLIVIPIGITYSILLIKI